MEYPSRIEDERNETEEIHFCPDHPDTELLSVENEESPGNVVTVYTCPKDLRTYPEELFEKKNGE